MEPMTPDFTLDSSSPPHFTYDFDANPSTSPLGTFDPFSPYSSGFGETSPRLGFGSLALGTIHAPTPSPFFPTPHHNHHPGEFPAISPTAHNFTSASTSGGHPFTPLEGTDLTTIHPPLTLRYQEGSTYPGVSSSEVKETTARAEASRRYNPIAGPRSQRPTRKSARRGVRRDEDHISDEEGDGMPEEPMDVGISSPDQIQRCREEIRRQRIESEQRRRGELRDAYAKLKLALPISNQKSSKVSLLDRAVTHIHHLETSQTTLQTRLDNAQNGLTRLRGAHEQLMRNLEAQHRAVMIAAANANANVGQMGSSSPTVTEPSSPAGKKTANKSSSLPSENRRGSSRT